MAEEKKKKSKRKKKEKKNVPFAHCHISSGFGNTMVSFSDPGGNILCWSSAGLLGFKGSRKGTPFVAQSVAEDAARKAREHGVRSVEAYIKGPGAGREMTVRALIRSGLRLSLLKDVTPLPHNGCRPPKKRRV